MPGCSPHLNSCWILQHYPLEDGTTQACTIKRHVFELRSDEACTAEVRANEAHTAQARSVKNRDVHGRTVEYDIAQLGRGEIDAH